MDDEGNLRSGPQGKHVMTNLEVRQMIAEINREQLYSLIARPRETVRAGSTQTQNSAALNLGRVLVAHPAVSVEGFEMQPKAGPSLRTGPATSVACLGSNRGRPSEVETVVNELLPKSLAHHYTEAEVRSRLRGSEQAPLFSSGWGAPGSYRLARKLSLCFRAPIPVMADLCRCGPPTCEALVAAVPGPPPAGG